MHTSLRIRFLQATQRFAGTTAQIDDSLRLVTHIMQSLKQAFSHLFLQYRRIIVAFSRFIEEFSNRSFIQPWRIEQIQEYSRVGLSHAVSTRPGPGQVRNRVNRISFGSGFYLNPRRNISDFALDTSVEPYAPKLCVTRINS
jgi:hypothetical protein